MTNRELFHATMMRDNGDQLLHFEQAFNVPYKKWYQEGLPSYTVATSSGWPELSEVENLYDYFNVTGWMFCMFDQFCIPAHEEKTIEVKGGRRTTINRNGNILMWIDDAIYHNEDGTTRGSPPHEIEFSIKSMADYKANRFRYIGNIKQRIDDQWLKNNAVPYRDQNDFITAIWVHGPYAFLRELLGTENAMIMPYEEPEMIEMILRDHLETCIAASEVMIKTCKPDCSFVWEDCCGSSGPFISPNVFDQSFAWWYKEWKRYLTSIGVRWAILDTDGDPSPLIKKWYESGIDCIHPWEVNGVDMLKFAEEYPQYVMMGGIYKHMFEPGDISQVGRFKTTDVYQEIDFELDRVLRPMRKRGGYFPSLDHAANQSTSYAGYKYYCDCLTQKYGKANQVTRKFKKC